MVGKTQVVHAKTNCDGFKEHGITFPSSHMQKQLLLDFYRECKVDRSSLTFLEAHGTGKYGKPTILANVLDQKLIKKSSIFNKFSF